MSVFEVEFLREFIKQSGEGNLKTSIYPKELADLKIKVSLGLGMPARVPLVSSTTPRMTTSNGYDPVYLYYKGRNILILAYGISETTEYRSNWPLEIQSSHTKILDLIEDVPRSGDSNIFTTYAPKVETRKVSFEREGVQISEAQLVNDLEEILNSYKSILDMEGKNENSTVNSDLFYMEQQLEDFIIENWDETEFGKTLDLIKENGVAKSQQNQTDIDQMDILARDIKSGSYVAIELKRNQTSNHTVGQGLRHMGSGRKHLGDENVHEIIVAGKYDEKLYNAQNMISSVDVFLYVVNFNLKEYSK